MSVNNILQKLAEKKAADGDHEFAYHLIEATEKKSTKKVSSTLNNLINKYAKKSEKGSFKSKLKEMDGFCGMRGKGYGYKTKAQATKALSVAEQAAVFLNWKVAKHEDCFVLDEHGKDSKPKTMKKAQIYDSPNDQYNPDDFNPPLPGELGDDPKAEHEERMDKILEEIMREMPEDIENKSSQEAFRIGAIFCLKNIY